MPGADEVPLTIVIPAYRERDKIQDDVRGAWSFLAREFGGRGEIVVVDDGSPDDTAARAEALAPEVPALRVLRCRENRGKGSALRAGVAASRGRRVLFADAGGCVAFDEARRGLRLLAGGADFAHGSRRAPGAMVEQPQPLHRRLGGALFRLAARLALGLPRGVRDPQCGFKVYDGDTARRVYGECFTDGFMLDIELLRRARRHGLRVEEFPVRWRADRDSRYRLVRGTLDNVRELIRIRLRC